MPRKKAKTPALTPRDEWEMHVRRLARLRQVSCPPQWVKDTIAAIEARKLVLEAELWPGKYGTTA